MKEIRHIPLARTRMPERQCRNWYINWGTCNAWQLTIKWMINNLLCNNIIKRQPAFVGLRKYILAWMKSTSMSYNWVQNNVTSTAMSDTCAAVTVHFSWECDYAHLLSDILPILFLVDNVLLSDSITTITNNTSVSFLGILYPDYIKSNVMREDIQLDGHLYNK